MTPVIVLAFAAALTQKSSSNLSNTVALTQQFQRGQRGQRGPGGGGGMFPGGGPAGGQGAGSEASKPDILGDTGPFSPMFANKPENWVSTKHSITIKGQKIDYTATCGFLPIVNRQGEVKANMFFVAYTKDGEDPTKRPVTFAFNGGPGSASLWLHMGALGPMRAEMLPDGHLPKPPYHVVPNEESWIPYTDIVMLDAVGTGFSRNVQHGDSEFYGRNGDLTAFTSGITRYMTDESRWKSPIFVAGESYGGFRVAGLSNSLLQAGVGVNGIISISGVMNMDTIDPAKDNDIPYISYFPSEAAVAYYHKKLSPAMMKSFPDLIKKAEDFDLGPYAAALVKGILPPAEKDKIAGEMSQLLGLSKKFILNANLRVNPSAFMGELMNDEHESTGRYDARILGDESNPNFPRPDYDASDAATSPVFTSIINSYLRDDLGWKSPAQYRIFGPTYPWPFDGNNDTSDDLRQALTQNPYTKVMFCFSYFDLACPYMGTRYVVSHMGLPAKLEKNIEYTYYKSGHMLYTNTPSRIELQENIGKFIDSAK